MHITLSGIGKFAVVAGSGSAMEVAIQRVNKVTEQLADIVFNEPPTIGLSAVVSFLATQLSVHPEPHAKTEAVVTVLRELVALNMTQDEAQSVYLFIAKGELGCGHTKQAGAGIPPGLAARDHSRVL